jgi:hypothetical protein
MRKYLSMILVGIMLSACSPTNAGDIEKDSLVKDNLEAVEVVENIDNSEVLMTEIKESIIHTNENTIGDRFGVLEGFERVELLENSFGDYLRNLPLKAHGESVYYYNGSEKVNYDVYEAVIDMDIGDRDLQQCADAIMRLKGEYLYNNNRFDEIHFNLTNGFRMDYSKWIEGNRLVVEGNKTYWNKKAGKSNTYDDFRKYMDMVFSYAGTLSLSNELVDVDCSDMEIGDIFIQGGSPGHAVIVVDMAINKDTGEKAFILAQSYMPAQDIHILTNQYHEDKSPWYILGCGEIIRTPEWTFTRNDLKRFAK